jgi:hypothetical protein
VVQAASWRSVLFYGCLWVASAATGTFLGMAGTLTWFRADQRSWEAISAVATSTAVIIALYPLWMEHRREERQRIELERRAEALRTEIDANLAILEIGLLGRYTIPKGATTYPVTGPLDERELDACAQLEGLLTNAFILREKEFKALNQIRVLTRFARMTSIEPDQARKFHASIERAVRAFGIRPPVSYDESPPPPPSTAQSPPPPTDDPQRLPPSRD